MKWQVLGAGAIGCLFAAKLKQQGAAVHLVLKPGRSTTSLSLTDRTGRRHTLDISASPTLQPEASIILVSLKAWQVADAIQQQLKQIHPSSIIILLHNGMGTLAQCQTLLPNNQIWQASTTHGALLNAPFCVTHTGQGETLIGQSQSAKPPKMPAKMSSDNLEQQAAITQALNDALPACHWHHKINDAIWAKLVINCAINPLTAIDQVPNGDLSKAQYQQSIEQICHECCAVALADGVPLEQQAMQDKIKQVIRATAENFSSMNRDIFHQRRTENDYILGYVIARANQHQLAVPVCQALYQQLKQQEKALCQS